MPTLAAWKTDKQLNPNSAKRSRRYPEPSSAIHQQKTQLVSETPAGYPRQRCYPCQGAAKSRQVLSPFFILWHAMRVLRCLFQTTMQQRLKLRAAA